MVYADCIWARWKIFGLIFGCCPVASAEPATAVGGLAACGLSVSSKKHLLLLRRHVARKYAVSYGINRVANLHGLVLDIGNLTYACYTAWRAWVDCSKRLKILRIAGRSGNVYLEFFGHPIIPPQTSRP
jgi:hypothetical protein